MDRGAWWATVCGVTKSWTWLRDWEPLCISYIFFIHSFIDGYLDCFFILIIVNSAEVNIGFQILALQWLFGYDINAQETGK